MTAPHTGAIPAPDLHAACCEVAGILAEHGVPSLRLHAPGSPVRTLQTRTLDLPGTLAHAAPCRIETDGLTIDIGADRIAWSTTDPALAADLVRLAQPG